MCGIAGILAAPRISRDRLAAIGRMAAALRHRGPDGGGKWVDHDAGIALGHRRLCIIDLTSAGRQPMVSARGRFVLTFNGEIYNFGELRRDLEKRCCFRGHSDSEVMLAAFEELGIETALSRFAGMFALGVWDRKDRVLHLVRDRMGKKPLYAAVLDGILLFGSELKAILAFPGFRPVIDPAALALMLRYGFVPEGHCIWRDIFKLPPGAMLSIRTADLGDCSAAQLKQRVHVWWPLADVAEVGQRQPFSLTPEECDTELHRLLSLAVEQRMVADVPLGAFLSGGIDSSAVVALMQAKSRKAVRTFTISFRESEYNEGVHASKVARHLRTEHTEFCLTADDALAVIPDLPHVWDEPFSDESQLPTLLMTRKVRSYVTVALTGDGADECFAGYGRHYITAKLKALFGMPQPLRRKAASALLMLSPSAWDAIVSAFPIPAGLRQNISGENLWRLAHILGAADHRELYDGLVTFGHSSVARNPPDAAAAPPFPHFPGLISTLLYGDMVSYLPGDVLVKLDRASMAAGLEARCPFLDHRVVEFAWHLPAEMKIRDGKSKWLLRRLLSRYLPQELIERPKHGFNVPIGAWLRGVLRDWSEEMLSESRIKREGLLHPGRIQALWRGHLNDRSGYRSRELWAILMFESWLNGADERMSNRSFDFEPDGWAGESVA